MRPESTSVVFRSDLSATASEYAAEKAAGRFIGLKAAPIFSVPEADGEYPIMRRANFKKRTPNDRATDGAYNRITGEFGKGTFSTEDRGLEERIDDRRRKRYRNLFDAEAAATRQLIFQQMLNHEYRVATLYSDGGWTNTNVATAWSTVATAVPLTDIQTGIDKLADKCGASPDEIKLIIPRADFREMIATTQINNKLLYTYPGIQPASLTPLQVAAMLGIKEVLVASGVQDSKEEGIAETNAQIWTAGVIYIAVLCEQEDDLEIPSAARSILWTEDSEVLNMVETYREDKTRSDIVRVRDDGDEVLIGETDLFVYKLTNT